MNKARYSKKNLFLLELLISIVLFMLLLIVGLQFFIRAHKITNKTEQLHEAVTICNNLAAIFESGDGTYHSIDEYYASDIETDSKCLIALNSNFEECDSTDERMYYVSIIISEETEQLSNALISVYDSNDEEIYSLTAYHYTRLQKKEGR